MKFTTNLSSLALALITLAASVGCASSTDSAEETEAVEDDLSQGLPRIDLGYHYALHGFFTTRSGDYSAWMAPAGDGISRIQLQDKDGNVSELTAEISEVKAPGSAATSHANLKVKQGSGAFANQANIKVRGYSDFSTRSVFFFYTTQGRIMLQSGECGQACASKPSWF